MRSKKGEREGRREGGKDEGIEGGRREEDRARS